MRLAFFSLCTLAASGCAVTPEFSTVQIDTADTGAELLQAARDRRTSYRLPTAEIAIVPSISYNANNDSWTGDMRVSAIPKPYGPYFASKGTTGWLTRTQATFDVDEGTKLLASIKIETEDLLAARIESASKLVAGIIGLDGGGTIPDSIKTLATLPQKGIAIDLTQYIANDGYAELSEVKVTTKKPGDDTEMETGWSYKVEFGPEDDSSFQITQSIIDMARDGVLFHSGCIQASVRLTFDGSARDTRLGDIETPFRLTASEISNLPHYVITENITVPDPINVGVFVMPAQGSATFKGCEVSITEKGLVERDPIAIGQTLIDSVESIKKALE